MLQNPYSRRAKILSSIQTRMVDWLLSVDTVEVTQRSASLNPIKELWIHVDTSDDVNCIRYLRIVFGPNPVRDDLPSGILHIEKELTQFFYVTIEHICWANQFPSTLSTVQSSSPIGWSLNLFHTSLELDLPNGGHWRTDVSHTKCNLNLSSQRARVIALQKCIISAISCLSNISRTSRASFWAARKHGSNDSNH